MTTSHSPASRGLALPAPLASAGVEPTEHANELVARLSDRGLQAVAVLSEDRLASGAPAVKARRPDAEADRVVVLLPTPARDLQWHWERPLLRYRDPDYRWYQPFCPAGDYDRVAEAVADRLARRAHVPHMPHVGLGQSAGDQIERQLLDGIGRPLHTLAWQMLEALAETQRTVEDPALLRRLFQLDHLAMRELRGLERLAVLSGATARRLPEPLALSTVLRQAGAQVGQYRRVRVPPTQIAMDLSPDAAPEIMLLLAELLENATQWSPPDTNVQVTASRTEYGVRIEVTDRGLSISPQKQAALNRMLAAPETVGISEQIVAGPIGLLVVAWLAKRHNVRVGLHPHQGGTRAVVELPKALLLEPQPPAPPIDLAAHPPRGSQAAAVAPAHEPALGPASAAPTPAPDERQRLHSSTTPTAGAGTGADAELGDAATVSDPPPLPRRHTAWPPAGAPVAANGNAPRTCTATSPDPGSSAGETAIDPAADFLQGLQDAASGRADVPAGSDPPDAPPTD